MSHDEDKKSSIMKRLTPYIPVIVAGAVIGAAIVMKFHHPTMKWTGDVLLSDRMLQQIKEQGGGMFHIEETNQFVDLIDWAHPKTITK